MAGLVRELTPAEMALAMLAAGDLEKAELWERRSERLWSEEWAPYAVAKAEALLARGHLDEAEDALANVHRSHLDRLSYRRARDRMAAARGLRTPAGDPLDAASPWSYLRGEASLELATSRPSGGLELAIEGAPPAGTAIELQLDGGTIGCFPVVTGERLRLPLVVQPGAHLLALREVAGERVVPGAVALPPATRAAAPPPTR
jgi:hypothetical protein